MNSDDFYQEVIESNLCPNDFHNIYSEFQRFQALVMNTLLSFHYVCEKNHVSYQLAFGSLLAAVRDDGQIPWDYDIDVFIPYEERNILIESLKKDLSNDYYFYCPEMNPECRHYFMRVSPKGYRSDKLHIDVFYLIGDSEEENERISFETEMMKFFELRYIKLVNVRDYDNYKTRISLLLRKIKYLPLSLDAINSRLDQICNKYNPKVTGVTTPVFTVYKHLSWQTKLLWDTQLIETSKGTFRITKNYDYILSSIYGDYKKIYPLKNRLTEMLNCYAELTGKHSLIDNSNGRYYINSDNG